MENRLTVGLAHGDVNGIGYELIIKMMTENKICDLCTPILFGSSKAAAYHRKALNIEGFALNSIQKPEEANAKRCNVKRVMAEAVKWGKRGARINSISPGIIVTPLALDEFNGPRGDFYKDMFARCPAGRPGTADEVANVAELLMSEKGAFITGADFLVDGGATATYFYGRQEH